MIAKTNDLRQSKYQQRFVKIVNTMNSARGQFPLAYAEALTKTFAFERNSQEKLLSHRIAAVREALCDQNYWLSIKLIKNFQRCRLFIYLFRGRICGVVASVLRFLYLFRSSRAQIIFEKLSPFNINYFSGLNIRARCTLGWAPGKTCRREDFVSLFNELKRRH